MRMIIKPQKKAKVNWKELSEEDQLIIENMVMIVGVLFNMCKVQLVKKSSRSNTNVVNKEDISNAQTNAQDAIAQLRCA